MNNYLVKKGDFLKSVYYVYGKKDISYIIHLRDALNVIIDLRCNNAFDFIEYCNSLKGYISFSHIPNQTTFLYN